MKISGSIALVCAGLLSGCVTAPKVAMAPTPICHGKQQCSVEWAEARTFVIDHAGMKIQTYSSDFLQTYNPINDTTDLAALVNKQPLPDGSYKIVARFWCDNIFGCLPDQTATLSEFNRKVAAAGAIK